MLDHDRYNPAVYYQGYVSAEESASFINKEEKVEQKVISGLNILTTVT